MKKLFFICFLIPALSTAKTDAEYEKWLHNIYLKHYKEPTSYEDWNNKIRNLPKTHKLKFKDNLWDLSDSFFRKPLYWSKMWVVNPKIENPHRIYQGNLIKLDPLALLQVNKSKLSVDLQEQFPGLELPPLYSKPSLTNSEIPSSFPETKVSYKVIDEIDTSKLAAFKAPQKSVIGFYLADSSPRSAGQIVATESYGKAFGVTGETAILRLNASASVGDQFTVFTSNRSLGGFLSSVIGAGEYQIQIKGVLKITSYIQGSNLYKAQVLTALDPLYKTDSIFKGSPALYNLSKKKIGKAQGKIIDTPSSGKSLSTVGSLVYLNKGTDDSLYEEDTFYIRPTQSGAIDRAYNYSGAFVGLLKVIHTAKNKSTAVIISAKDSIYIGDSFGGLIDRVELEQIEASEFLDEGQELLKDIEEIETAPEDSFEILQDEREETDESLNEEFEDLNDNRLGEDFEVESIESPRPTNLKEEEKDQDLDDEFKFLIEEQDIPEDNTETLQEDDEEFEEAIEEDLDEEDYEEHTEEDDPSPDSELKDLEDIDVF